MIGGLKQLQKAFPDHKNLGKMVATTEKLFNLNDTRVSEDGYKIRPSYHVTSLFVGGNEDKVKSSIYQNFEVGKVVSIPVRALIFVPGKIFTAVCFPET
jgi:hypothetical protein